MPVYHTRSTSCRSYSGSVPTVDCPETLSTDSLMLDPDGVTPLCRSPTAYYGGILLVPIKDLPLIGNNSAEVGGASGGTDTWPSHNRLTAILVFTVLICVRIVFYCDSMTHK